jgi:hypothetical protein
LALNLDNLGDHELLVFLEPALKVSEISVAFVGFELFPCERGLFSRLVLLALVALDPDLATFSLQVVDDLGVGHCKLIIFTLAEASVLPGWTF